MSQRLEHRAVDYLLRESGYVSPISYRGTPSWERGYYATDRFATTSPHARPQNGSRLFDLEWPAVTHGSSQTAIRDKRRARPDQAVSDVSPHERPFAEKKTRGQARGTALVCFATIRGWPFAKTKMNDTS